MIQHSAMKRTILALAAISPVVPTLAIVKGKEQDKGILVRDPTYVEGEEECKESCHHHTLLQLYHVLP